MNQMYMRKQKLNNRCRKQTSVYQWEEGWAKIGVGC